MAKTNKEKILEICKEINKKNGAGSIYTVDSKHADLKIDRWSTGLMDLDAIIGGGMPEGRIVEISGVESSGKTSLLYHLCAMHDICLDIPCEGTFDAARAKTFGNRKGQLLIYRSKCGEDAFNKIVKFAQQGIPLIGVDSVPYLVPQEDKQKIVKAARADTLEELRIGGVARLMSKYLPSVVDLTETTGSTLIFVNQERDKMKAMMFGEKTDTPGGHALKHACSLRIKVARKSWIEIPNKNPANPAKEEKVGLIMKCKVIKSKVCNPLGECELPLFFDRGFVSFNDVDAIRKELMQESKKKYK